MQALPGDFITDRFLTEDPDCPVFGLNLACAWPFPVAVAGHYQSMADELAGLDPGAYVYPLWETHVTIMTFLNFTLAQRPTVERLREVQTCIAPIVRLVNVSAIRPFRLEFQRPTLTRKAATLPISNPTGEIAQIRREIGRAISAQPELHSKLAQGGLNVPDIIHSTILRFKSAPPDPKKFAVRFAEAAAQAEPFRITIRELLLTAETRPYMRGGEILHCWALGGIIYLSNPNS